jgi:group II intron reverse transcriptase/maturase
MAKGGRDSDDEEWGVREMRSAEHVLAIIQERGQRGLPLEDVYRQLYNPDLYLKAYGKIYRNSGAMTPGVTTETVDGMTLAKIEGIIGLLREEKYRWTPVRRVYIEKKNSTKQRPLGILVWSDKLLQEVIRLILDAYYEPQFADQSHGFRPHRGCHTALTEIHRTWPGTVWIIEGDIKGCYDNIDHAILVSIIAEKVHDKRFLRLLEGLCKAGYVEEWQYRASLSGTPQGGIASPILANIYLDRLDQYIVGTLIPQHTRGEHRRTNPAYNRAKTRAHKLLRLGHKEEALALIKETQKLPSVDPNDAEYRRLRYVRYADDFLLGFKGPRAEAEDIKAQIGAFLRETLRLDLSEEKTLITHARTEKARFLGYELSVFHNNSARYKGGTAIFGQRTVNGRVRLGVPRGVVREKQRQYMACERPVHRTERTVNSDYDIVTQFQSEYRGIANYYRMAHDLARFSTLKWVMEVSLTKTLAHKHKVSVGTVYRRHATTVATNGKTYKALQVVVQRDGKKPLVATWGGIPLIRDTNPTRLDDQPTPFRGNVRTELVQRLLADTCELCGSREQVRVHHIRRLKDLRKHRRPRPEWVRLLAARQRKTLVVCLHCHVDIHAGRPLRDRPTESPGEPDDAKVSRPVRRGADGKVPA